MGDAPFRLDAPSRAVVLRAVVEVCEHESWTLHAAHVRTSHVHIVLTAARAPEYALGKIKSYASRALNATEGEVRKRWTRHGSTVYLWDAGQLYDAVEYTHLRQVAPMTRYLNANLWPQFA